MLRIVENGKRIAFYVERWYYASMLFVSRWLMHTAVLTLREHRVIGRINHFLASPYYIMLVVLAAGAANLFALELPVYTLWYIPACWAET